MKITPNRFWIGLFGLWVIFLFKSPGALQAIQLQRMIDAKQTQIDQAENHLIALQDEATRLEKSRVIQEREIRRVLGYTAPNELVFDFN